MAKGKMPPTQGERWVIWLKWENVGWQPEFVVQEYKDSAVSAKSILESWAENNWPSCWGENWRKRKVRILPEGQYPKEYKRKEDS